MTNNNHYDYGDCFFDEATPESLTSARIIVPLLITLIQPRTVVDVGCGQGAWLKVFQECGVETVQGLDGPWVDTSRLLIDKQNFNAVDLSRSFEIPGSYDLAICLEVAEHLRVSASRSLIRTLTAAAPLVLFSAAIPGQGGTHHVNEQWPSYWKSLFAEYGFTRLDAVRRYVWQDHQIKWWYRQNVFLFASDKSIAESSRLRAEQDYTRDMEFDFVHIRVLNRYTSLKGILCEVAPAAWRALKRRIYYR